MSIIAICNIGTRDVMVAGEPALKPDATKEEKAAREPRVRGERLLREVAANPAVANTLSFPIIQPAIEYILRQHDQLDRLIFIGTDQSEETEERFRATDTLHYAALISAEFAHRYAGQIHHVEAQIIRNQNPSIYDEVYDHYGRLLDKHVPIAPTQVYLMATAGTPACNTALLLQGVRQFGNRCQVIYQSQGREPWPLRVGSQVLDLIRENTVIELLQRFDFDAADSVLSSATNPPELPSALSRYACRRLWFDFPAASQHLEMAIRASNGSNRDLLTPLRPELAALQSGQDERVLTSELFHNACISWDNGAYLDFLSRSVRFLEGALRLFAIEELNETMSPTTFTPRERQIVIGSLRRAKASESSSTATPDVAVLTKIRTCLSEGFKLSELADLCFDLGISYESISGDTIDAKARELVQYTGRRGQIPALVAHASRLRPNLAWPEDHQLLPDSMRRWQDVVAILDGLERLASLRDESILGHGKGGASAEIILNRFRNKNQDEQRSPIEAMSIVCQALGIANANPFRVIRDLIISYLRHNE